MKLKLLLYVDYDDEQESSMDSAVRYNPVVNSMADHVGAHGSFIWVRKDSNTPCFDGPSVLAHEIGHVIAGNLGLPNEVERAETKARVAGTCFRAEIEAWDVAVATGIPIDAECRQYALKTYSQG